MASFVPISLNYLEKSIKPYEIYVPIHPVDRLDEGTTSIELN